MQQGNRRPHFACTVHSHHPSWPIPFAGNAAVTEWSLLLHDIIGNQMIPSAANALQYIVSGEENRDLRIVFLRSNRILNRIGRPIRFRIEFSNRIGRIYHASRNTLQQIFNPFHRYLFCICHERE